MGMQLQHLNGGKALEIKASGKLTGDDYREFGPAFERAFMERGKVRILLRLEDFHGWTAKALWEDIKFDARHFNDVERLAVIGETRWQEWMTTFSRPFTTAKVRYFHPDQADEAREWVLQN